MRRLKDGSLFALKFLQPKDSHDFTNIKNEVGFMMQCSDEDSILKCIDAFDYKQRLWIFLEMMDLGALTELIEQKHGSISEKICSYILLKTLQGV